MAKIIIFGIQENAEMAEYYIERDTEHEVIAFCVDPEYITGNIFLNKPVISFSDIVENFPPEDYLFFAPISAKNMNMDREKIVKKIKLKGYALISYVSSKSNVFNNTFGENCFILENNVIQPFVKIGSNVMMWSGNHIGHHSIIHDNVTITSHVIISGRCTVKSYSYVGVNSSIRDGVIVAEGTFLTMGSLITSDTKEWSVYKNESSLLTRISSRRMKI